jgi:hypothetical protein
MQMPPLNPDTLFEDLLQDLPPETIQMARECKAFTRVRKIKTPAQLLRAVLLYCGLAKALRDVAGTLTQLEERITATAVAARLTACRPWVKALLPKMLPRAPLAALPTTRRWLVIDGSTVQSPGATGISYRLHLCLDLVTLECTALTITDVRTGESLRNFALGPGDVAVADRGYSHPGAIVDTVRAGAELLVRLNPHNVPLGHRDGTALDLVAAWDDQPSATVRTLPVRVGTPSTSECVEGWVHAYRLSEAQAKKARQACRQRNSKKGRTPQPATLFLAGWVLVCTTLAPAPVSATTVLALYRTRWQVEIAIQRWKSLLDVDALRAREGSPLADLWLHGKLLYALMLERRMRRTMGDAWGRLDHARQATWWRPWKLMQDGIAPRITGALAWSEQAWDTCLDVLRERPRRRTLQRLPADACAVLPSHDIPLIPWEEELAA